VSSAFSAWIAPRPHDARRSVDLVRFTVAAVLVSHPLHAVVHPADAAALAAGLAARGLPGALAVAWAALGLVLACAVGLASRRLAALAAVTAAVVVTAGAAALYAPRWFVVGGFAERGQPGIEHSALIVACLVAIAWTYAPRRGAAPSPRAAAIGLAIVRVASALVLVPHGAGSFVVWDVAGMRAWGEGMSQLGFPCGVALVWSLKGLELVSAVARLAGRVVVPACVGNLVILVPGMWIAHHMRWFVVGPGEGGIEYSALLIACTVACMLAYWPAPRRERAHTAGP